MAKLFSIISLVLVIILFPPAVLAVISNNAVPGDATYLVKRSLEDIMYAAVSINPISKAWFSRTRSNRRFKEVTTLLVNGKSAKNSLQELVSQTAVAAEQIKRIEDPTKKQEAIKNLADSIQNYNQGLLKVSGQSGSSNTTESVPSKVAQNPPVPESTTVPTPKGTSAPVRISYTLPQMSAQPAITQSSQNIPPVTPAPTNALPQVPTAAPGANNLLTKPEDDQISQTVAQLQQISQQLQQQSVSEQEKDKKIKENKESDKFDQQYSSKQQDKEDTKESIKQDKTNNFKSKRD